MAATCTPGVDVGDIDGPIDAAGGFPEEIVAPDVGDAGFDAVIPWPGSKLLALALTATVPIAIHASNNTMHFGIVG